MDPRSDIGTQLRAAADRLPVSEAPIDSIVRRGRRRRSARATGYLLGVALLATALVSGLSGLEHLHDRYLKLPDGRSIQKPAIQATIPLGGAGWGVAYGEGSVWVASIDRHSLIRIDPKTDRVVTSIPLGAEVFEVVAGEGGVWVILGHDELVKIDPTTNRVDPSFSGRGSTYGMALSDGSLWVTVDGVTHENLLRLDPQTGRVIETIPIPGWAIDVAVGAGAVWVGGVAPDGNRVFRVRGTHVDTVTLQDPRPNHSSGAVHLAVGDGTVWAVTGLGDSGSNGDSLPPGTQTDSRLWQIDADSLRIVGSPTSVGPKASALVFSDGVVWVLHQIETGGPAGATFLAIVDPRSGQLVGDPIEVGASAVRIAAGGGSLWIPGIVHGSPVVTRLAP